MFNTSENIRYQPQKLGEHKKLAFWLTCSMGITTFLGALYWEGAQEAFVSRILLGSAVICLVAVIWIVLLWKMQRAQFVRGLVAMAAEADADGLSITDGQGNVIYANPAFHNLLSFAASETPSRQIDSLAQVSEAISAAEREGAAELIRIVMGSLERKSGVADFAVSGRQKDFGPDAKMSIEWRRMRVQPLCDSPDGREGDMCIWRVYDITDWREIESIRFAEEARMHDLVDFLPVGVFSADANGVLRFVNRTLASWLGQLPERLFGTPFADYVADVGENGEVILRDGEGRVFMASLVQSQRDALDGSIAYTRSIVIRDRARDSECVTNEVKQDARVETSNLTEAKSSEIFAASRSGSGMQGLFDEAPVGMVLLDLEGSVSDANRSFLRLLGRHRDAVIHRSFADFLAREDRGDVSSALSKIVMGIATAAHLEVHMHGIQARELILSLYISRILDLQGNMTALVLHLIDNTEQKNLEVQFAQSQKMQAVGQLAGGVAHDFNNLLTAMIGFCDLLLERHGPDDPSFADIQQIRQNTNRATNLVRQLLAFSRKQTLEPVRLDITEGLNDLASLIRRLIGEKVELVMDHSREIVTARGDKSQFDQIIINLCVNARDAMPGGGTISVRTENVKLTDPVQRGHDLMPAGRYAMVEVTDTGTGISKEHIERIFEPFFSTKEAGAGTGLGLSTVYGIVHQTGGFIFCDSAPGEGTTFSIFLPEFEKEPLGIINPAESIPLLPSETKRPEADVATELTASPEVEMQPPSDLTGVGKVLLVEDEDAVRMFAKRALENKGYRVIEAANGEVALDLVSSSEDQIDIIVSDVIMPGMDGHTLVGLVRQELPHVKVILMSGYAEDIYRDKIGRDGTLNFLSKPFTLKDLATKVKEVLG